MGPAQNPCRPPIAEERSSNEKARQAICRAGCHSQSISCCRSPAASDSLVLDQTDSVKQIRLASADLQKY